MKNKKISSADYLSFQRTLMANERTFLSYIRTSLAFLVVGGSFIKFFTSKWTLVIGWLFISFAIVIFFIGILRYKNFKSKIKIEN